MNRLSQEKPAILGGTPCFPNGPPGWPFPSHEVNQILQEAQQTGLWGKYDGPYSEQLQQELSTLHQSKEVILCSSGTVAVELALRGLGIGKGDEVILSAYDFEGNFKNILTVGATPILVDIDNKNCNLNINLLEQTVTKSTRCILISHLHGGIVPMQAVKKLSNQWGIPVIEDACQLPGAKIEGCIAGSCGDIGILSGGGSKLLTAGRGGAILTSSSQLAQRIRIYSRRGNEAYPLTDLQAGLLLPQLKTLHENNQKRQQNVTDLLQQLEKHPGLCGFHNRLDTTGDHTQPGYYKLGLQYKSDHFAGMTRELFCQAMQAEGIALHPGFRALNIIHSQKRFKQFHDLSVATTSDRNIVVLHHPILLKESTSMELIAQSVSRIRDHANEIVQMAGK